MLLSEIAIPRVSSTHDLYATKKRLAQQAKRTEQPAKTEMSMSSDAADDQTDLYDNKGKQRSKQENKEPGTTIDTYA